MYYTGNTPVEFNTTTYAVIHGGGRDPPGQPRAGLEGLWGPLKAGYPPLGDGLGQDSRQPPPDTGWSLGGSLPRVPQW
ncbi:MAG: hypothetical protein F7C37_07775 [Desulfurococcales archaeon]|nr:hypothetical protein [Desulfurococcales archaeon]